MTIRFELRTTKKFAEGEKSPLHISISDGRDFRKRQVTQIKVNPAAWDSKLGCLKKRYLMNEEERIAISSEMSNIGKSIVICPFEPKRFCPLKTFCNDPLKSLDRWGHYYYSLSAFICGHLTDAFAC